MTNGGAFGFPSRPGPAAWEHLTPRLTGFHYTGSFAVQTRTLAATLNRCYFAPAYTSLAITIDQLAVAVTSNTANATHRMGVFMPSSQSTPFALAPMSLVVDAGTVDTASSTGVKAATLAAPVAIPAGSWFFLAGAPQTAAATIQVGGASGATWFSPMGGNSTSGGYTMAMNISLFADSVSGAFAGTILPTGYLSVDGGVTYRRAT